MVSVLSDASILVTGGTGSFGQAFTRYALEELNPRRLAIFSRDELKQSEMKKKFDDGRIRWFLGDVRDVERLKRAFQGVDFVVHAAALKQVDTAEYNPYEYVKTNVLGSQNVIEAALSTSVSRVVALSTDKASSPINLYGATKLTADKLFVAGNNYSGDSGARFSIVRYGNVMGSRGSVIPIFEKLASEGKSLPITHRDMTRFWITLEQAVCFVVNAFESMSGGELFVPKIPSMRLLDLVEAICPGAKVHEIGIRPGEKLHEEMISPDDSPRTLSQEGRFVVTPTVEEWWFQKPSGKPVSPGFAYRSDSNEEWLSVDELRQILGTRSSASL